MHRAYSCVPLLLLLVWASLIQVSASLFPSKVRWNGVIDGGQFPRYFREILGEFALTIRQFAVSVTKWTPPA
jgi:hypothetical protein